MVTRLIILKLKETAPVDATLARLSQMPGVVKIERLLPGETDPELATLYTVADESTTADAVLKLLSTDMDIEFAEVPPSRKLI